MFQPSVPRTRIGSTVAFLELIFHATVRHVRKSNGNAIVGLLVSIAQSLVGIGVMVLMFSLIGRGIGTQVRGDFILFIMSGICAATPSVLRDVVESEWFRWAFGACVLLGMAYGMYAGLHTHKEVKCRLRSPEGPQA